ncbi:outer membrane immunogenic protein [Novosphingobium fluoreni]|uniref:Outer membrane immunogenic protein n=1 Tax=Novosphingobium fluoreni TaxID=1391222 RepID=A0A7W6C0P3_9SPHN|nr:outer membrane beta-barrel protein [Novosphingobium fluoreni]KTR84755.1 membrane protein [Novosphingobium barchaimii]MBB3938683.1 outer membrane immunogenic protein [Novosphingobium fluoreni]
MKKFLTLATVLAAGIAAQPAFAQDDTAPVVAENGTAFRGVRLEANAGGDRFMSEGNHNDKFGYGGTVGFDGQIGEKLVIGAEGSFWTPGKGNENCTGLANRNSICHKAFQEWGAAVRVGYLVTPQFLVFGKGGYVNREQRRRIDGPTGTQLVYDHYNADGYQVGGGAEFTLTQGRAPIYVNAQYVYSNYHGHSSAQRLMGGVGIRFR